MDRRIKAAIQLMLQDTKQRVPICEVARQVNLSPRRFNDLFKAETCLRPKECVRYWRLRQAKELLDHSFLKVHEVADAVGFRHLSSFTREFKKFYGYPPSVSRGPGSIEVAASLPANNSDKLHS
jgi:transcriptional regulator GlxA family with amidase domain